MLTDEIRKPIEILLLEHTGKTQHISKVRSVGGGCINQAFELESSSGSYFLKLNSAKTYPGMFESEAKGLKLLSDTQTMTIPEVIGTGESENQCFLLLQYIEHGNPGRNFWHEFGTKLADLHKNTSGFFGLDHDNYIGSLTQSNKMHDDFIGFFILERLEPQLKQARNKGAFSQSDIKYFNSLFKLLHNIIPVEKPALIHGDLWNGNFMVTCNGNPCLIDPAVYFGHREADIAMSLLFGGFQPEFYAAYNQTWLMEKGWQQRMDIFNLYPLLVHVNLFGGSYARQVLQIIRQF